MLRVKRSKGVGLIVGERSNKRGQVAGSFVGMFFATISILIILVVLGAMSGVVKQFAFKDACLSTGEKGSPLCVENSFEEEYERYVDLLYNYKTSVEANLLDGNTPKLELAYFATHYQPSHNDRYGITFFKVINESTNVKCSYDKIRNDETWSKVGVDSLWVCYNDGLKSINFYGNEKFNYSQSISEMRNFFVEMNKKDDSYKLLWEESYE
jgi:hypothetical protein